MKSIKIICSWLDRAFSFKASPWAVWLAVLLAGYILLGQGSDPRFQAEASTDDVITVEEYVEMGRVIVFGSLSHSAGHKMVGKGQCPFCHTFDFGDNIGRCPNLFGVEERSRTRIKEDRYQNEPIKIGETDETSGIVKGRPDLIPEEYRREGSPELTGEDYLRESMMCPSCYVVKGYGKAGDTISPMIHKPPISLSWVELNAVIAWLQAKDTPGDFSKVTVFLPKPEDLVRAAKSFRRKKVEDDPISVDCDNPGCVQKMINALGCPLCHVIPGIEGAEGELGPALHLKIAAPKRIKDPNYKGKARTAREYVEESILNHDVYIVFNKAKGEPYPSGLMPWDYYSNQLSVKALKVLVDFISNTQPEG